MGSRELLVPEFGEWTLNDVKDSAVQAIYKCLKQSGLRGVAALAIIAGIVWLGVQTVRSNMDSGDKARCVQVAVGALAVVFLTVQLTEKNKHATANQERGRDSADQPGAVPGDQGAARPAPTVNGRSLDGGGH